MGASRRVAGYCWDRPVPEARGLMRRLARAGGWRAIAGPARAEGKRAI